MKLVQFHYDLPPEAIAQEPIALRDHSKLLVLDRQTGRMTHKLFYEIGEFLRPGDVLVTNATKVFPARLRGKKITGGKVEALLLESKRGDGKSWRALIRGATQATDLRFPEDLSARMVRRLSEGEWEIQFSHNSLRSYLDRHGEMPLPPYIKRPMSQRCDMDLERYQTVYAKSEGAVAAPTAGFHFTDNLLKKLQTKGVQVQPIILHVGWGTFRPVRTENVEAHKMLPEHYVVLEEVARALNKAREEGRRIIAVGTTAVRTLETICDAAGQFHSGQGESELFIYPGYRFKAVDALITNFHLPDSTPLLLASAFYGGTPDDPFSLRKPYAEAIREKYRFYSYGDAMFIQ
jgi:S-adenosylmethionine:tRNA ribosyltransferase-isomerase